MILMVPTVDHLYSMCRNLLVTKDIGYFAFGVMAGCQGRFFGMTACKELPCHQNLYISITLYWRAKFYMPIVVMLAKLSTGSAC